MTQDKRGKLGARTNYTSAKSKTCDQRAKKKLSATLLSLLDTEDDLSNIQWGSVPLEVQDWLTVTFARKKEAYSIKPEDQPSIRTISYAVQASVLVKRMFRTPTSASGLAYPEKVIAAFKDIDKWDFDVFALNETCEGHSLKYLMCDLFNKYDLLRQFKIPITCLISFASALEVGYSKHQNPYHNVMHATDVTQTVHCIMLHTGMMHWFTDLEILAILFSTSIHDYEHTGTTNHFHVRTRSEMALLYNDKSVLENHHVSAVYQLMQNEDMNILVNLTNEEWRELRRLVIEMVLATDMSNHFQQMKYLKHVLKCLQHVKRTDRDKLMSMIVHAADISHPSKPWKLHQQWANALMDEFFKQGDKEAELGLPISPLCDRGTTNIAETQIGFIDVIVKPIFSLIIEAAEKIVEPLIYEAFETGCSSSRDSGYFSGYDCSSCFFWLPDSPMRNFKLTLSGSIEDENKPKLSGNSFEEEENVSLGSVKSESGTCTERNLLISLDIASFEEHLVHNIEANRKKWKESQEPKSKESPMKESNKAKDKVSKDKKEGGKPQKTSKPKHHPSKSNKLCIAPQSPTLCDCELCHNRAFEPMDVSFIVYNAGASELFQPQPDDEVMDVTESYEELVDNKSSWRKAAGQDTDKNIYEMRGMVPKTKPLRPNESDDVIIEEFIPDDPEPPKESEPPAVPDHNGAQMSPGLGFMSELTKSEVEFFSLWNEETMRRAAEQQKQDQSRMAADAALQVATSAKQNEGCQANSADQNFVLQVISIDTPIVTNRTESGQHCDPSQKEVASTSALKQDITTPSNACQQNETTPRGAGAAAVSVTSLSYGVFKIPQ
uniref:calcium/calmodulin-dependent 3',5'-cyclic nucleotide phosphodiesterase 1A-like n=1 Tax=Podarcis muralis TaxID=64176 RepID=UPI00109F875F|nr:calcium/calmodulin-dependent 3',5'-cyclic nucleotide phosphodiesterase 1A-like [Podarcis muralis]